MVSESTSWGLSARGAACLYGFRTYLQETVSQGCSLFIWFPNLPPGDCQQGVQPVYMVFEPIFRRLSARDAACLYISQTYLQWIAGQECSLFIWFPNLPSEDCLLGTKPIYMVPNLPPGTVCWGFSLFIRFLNRPPGDFSQGCSLFIQFPNQPPGDCWLWCSLFLWFLNLPPGDCQPGVQHVYMVSEPTFKGLSDVVGGGGRDAACLNGFQT